MKKSLFLLLFTLFILILYSCKNDNDDIEYGNKLEVYYFDVPSTKFIIPDSNFDYRFHIKNYKNDYGQIGTVDMLQIINDNDTVTIKNTYKIIEGKYVSNDTVKNNWVTAIIEEHKQLRVIMDKNNGLKTRTAKITLNVGEHFCYDTLTIYQLPPF